MPPLLEGRRCGTEPRQAVHNDPSVHPNLQHRQCIMWWRGSQRHCLLQSVCWAILIFAGIATASLGDRLPEFKSCVSVGPTALELTRAQGD